MSNAAKINDQYSMIPIFEDSELVRLARRRWHKRMRRAKHRAPVLLKIAVVLIGCGLFVKSAVVEAFYVPSTSMSPTVKAMDYILVEKFLYGLRVPFVERTVVPWSKPKRGEVVVFKRSDDPATTLDEGEQSLVKRVIGLEGDLVEIDGAAVHINGALLNEPYVRFLGGATGVQEVFRVPRGRVFVLGDNRNDSFDSRFWSDPFVALEQVIGKAVVVYWASADRRASGLIM